MPILTTSFLGDPNIGLYGFATDRYSICGVKNRHFEKLGVPFHTIALYGTHLTGLFAAGNSRGIVVSEFIGKRDVSHLRSFTKVLVLDTSYTAMGNLVLANDNGVVISPLLRKFRKEIAEFFNVECQISNIAGTAVPGSVAVATNVGCVVHPKIRPAETKLLENVLKVPLTISTVSFGSPFVKSGIIANTKGVLVSEETSGIELGYISEAFGL